MTIQYINTMLFKGHYVFLTAFYNCLASYLGLFVFVEAITNRLAVCLLSLQLLNEECSVIKLDLLYTSITFSNSNSNNINILLSQPTLVARVTVYIQP